MHEALLRLPEERFIYYADHRNTPYGTKPHEVVRDAVLTSVRHIMEESGQELRAVVVACNTATSVAIRDLRERYDIPIVGMEPAVKPAVELSRKSGRRVLVTATQLTLKETKFHELVKRVDDESIVDSLPLPGLVQYCEELQFEGEEIEAYFRRAFAGIDFQEYGTIVLGCTHFPFYRKTLAGLLPPHIRIVDGNEGTVRRLSQLLGEAQPSDRRIDVLPNRDADRVRFMCSDADEDYMIKMKTALRAYAERSMP